MQQDKSECPEIEKDIDDSTQFLKIDKHNEKHSHKNTIKIN